MADKTMLHAYIKQLGLEAGFDKNGRILAFTRKKTAETPLIPVSELFLTENGDWCVIHPNKGAVLNEEDIIEQVEELLLLRKTLILLKEHYQWGV